MFSPPPQNTHTSTHPLGEQDFPNDKSDADKERSTTTVCTLSESQAIQFRGIVAYHARGSIPDCWHSSQRVTMMECGNLISHSSHKGPGDRSMFGFYGQSLTEWKSLFFGEARQMRWNFKIQVQRSFARPTSQTDHYDHTLISLGSTTEYDALKTKTCSRNHHLLR